MSFLRRLFRIPNLVIIATIILGTAASIGITDRFYSHEKILTALVTLVAAQLLVDRLGILNSIFNKIDTSSQNYLIEVLPRTSQRFERFSSFAKNASEIMVIGVDLGFIANADAWFVKQALQKGVDLKLLIINPQTSTDFGAVINNHDERNVHKEKPVHDHVATAKDTLEILRAFTSPKTKGKLDIRARVDIPNPTMALVDPNKRHGKIRVELKLYKRNHGEVPYFVLDRTSVWYDMFFNHYYFELWNDSKVLFSSS